MRAHRDMLASGCRTGAQLLFAPIDAAFKVGARNYKVIELAAPHQSISVPLSRNGYEGPKSPTYSVCVTSRCPFHKCS